MKISWKWLSEFVDLSRAGTPEKLAEILTLRGLEVEEIHFLSKGFDQVVTAQILERNPHPQADRLSLCKLTIGESESLEIVCGASNIKTFDKVALALVGAHLPNGMKIARSKIRGVISNGMICSEEELKLKDKSEGVLILPVETPLGMPLAKVLGRDDIIFSFKLTPNRGDCLSHYGMAREVAAALGVKIRELETPIFSKFIEKKFSQNIISIELSAGNSAPQFLGCLIEDVKIGPSPQAVVHRLENLGFRSINNVVDATNLLMLECGHPLHAYDADQLQGDKIEVRIAHPGEPLPLLDGETITLKGFELVIADKKENENSSRVIGLAGVMGGGNSEVGPNTRRVFLECAEFSPSLVRRASAQHQRKTEASHRFERGVDPKGLERAISRLALKIVELSGGEICWFRAERLKLNNGAKVQQEIRLDLAWINQFLGTEFNMDTLLNIIKDQGCCITKNTDEEWVVFPPSYRLDLTIAEDLAEEVARSMGYDLIPIKVPQLTSQPNPVRTNPYHSNWLKIEEAKDALVRLGFLETINYSFTSQAWLAQFGFSSSPRLLNPMSEEYQCLVPSLIPSLVKNALENERHHFGSEEFPLRLFELRPVFSAEGEIKARGEMETGVKENWTVSWLMAGPRFANALRLEQAPLDFFDLKGVATVFFDLVGSHGVRFQVLRPSSQGLVARRLYSVLHPGRSVEILAGKTSVGVLGLLHPKIQRELKIRSPLWVGEIDWDSLQSATFPIHEPRVFKSWSEFPTMERDFALIVKKDVRAEQIIQLALKAGKPLAKVAKIFDIYQGSQIVEGMTSVAVRVIFFDEGRSLEEAETEGACKQILEVWKKELAAELRQ